MIWVAYDQGIIDFEKVIRLENMGRKNNCTLWKIYFDNGDTVTITSNFDSTSMNEFLSQFNSKYGRSRI